MTHDSIHRPAHYAEGRIYEPIAVIEDWDLNYRLGNTVKYISRAGRKQNALEDLKKARWYLDREIDRLELNQEPPTNYEEVLTFYGQTQDDSIAWPDVDDQALDYWSGADAFAEGAFSVNDFWMEQPDYVTGWDPSLGPVEFAPEEIEERLSKKDLDQFADDEIVTTVERRGMILGFRKDGTSCVLKNGTCQ